jgi:acyl CoA:acetate/3-ketoacid CoA transferase beta subunit
MFRGDGEIVAAAVAGMTPALGARLARSTFEPDLLTTDGGPFLTAEPVPLGAPAGDVEGWLPFRDHLWLVLNGKRHVVLGPSQIDRYGNSNISNIGDWARPKSQLLGARRARKHPVQHHQLLDPQALHPRLHRAGRLRQRHRL